MRDWKAAATALLLAVSLCGCQIEYRYDPSTYYDQNFWTQESSVLNGIDFQEDKSVYDLYEKEEPVCLYLKIQEGRDQERGKTYSFSYLKSYTDSDLDQGEEPYCDAIMSVGTDQQSSTMGGFGFGEMTANAKITVKGNTDTIKSRSWQIKLYDRAGLYEGARTFNLIKNTDDASRMKIRLGSDVVAQVPDVGGLRTEFVRLFVCDTTDGGDLQWVDMGIYTYVEQPNKAWLEAHSLDENATLYRAKDFCFEQEEALRSKDDPLYDEDAFEEILNIREAENHDKLLEMLEAVNAPDARIEDLMGRYFNEENILAYCAVNILLGNAKAASEDYLLYSPENSDTWYFVCEDFRNAMEHTDMTGYGFLLNNRLFRLYLSDQENRKKLQDKIAEIRRTVDDTFVQEHLATYKTEILRYLYSVPEINQLPVPAEEVEPYIDGMFTSIKAAARTDLSVEVPYLTGYSRQGNTVRLEFEPVPDYEYTVQISADRKFETLVEHGHVRDQSFTYAFSGSYYLRLVAEAPDGSTVICGNISRDNMGRMVYGGIEVEQER